MTVFFSKINARINNKFLNYLSPNPSIYSYLELSKNKHMSKNNTNQLLYEDD